LQRRSRDEFAIAWHPDHHSLLDSARPDGAIVATPNALHVSVALEFVSAGIPVLVEKPIADRVEQARRLSDAAEKAGVRLLVGHHRRHNPIIRCARELVRSGSLGRVVVASSLAMFLKPDAYFEVAWRRAPGGGPVLIDLIHEIDLLRFVCGEIRSLQAIASNAARGFAVEDTAATILRFEDGAIATIMLSDTAVSPWSCDLTSGENPAFLNPKADTHFICRTEASVTLPRLNLRRYAKEWSSRLRGSPSRLWRQIPTRNRCGTSRPLFAPRESIVTGPGAIRRREATPAVKRAAETGEAVSFS
jgi:hypothetical protein